MMAAVDTARTVGGGIVLELSCGEIMDVDAAGIAGLEVFAGSEREAKLAVGPSELSIDVATSACRGSRSFSSCALAVRMAATFAAAIFLALAYAISSPRISAAS
jgi:hypothetical protein